MVFNLKINQKKKSKDLMIYIITYTYLLESSVGTVL